MNVRAIAAKTLAPVLRQSASLSSTFETNRTKIAENERSLFQELCFGTLRNYYLLDSQLSQLLGKPLRNKDADVKALLLIGLHQLLNMRVPDHAVISETVNASTKLKKTWAKALVNGVLRQATRTHEPEEQVEQQQENLEAIYNHPAWLIGKLKKSWPDHWQQILEANNQQPPIHIRINLRETTRESYLEALSSRDVSYSESKYSHTCIRIDSKQDIKSLPGYDQGFFSVQNEAAQLSAPLLQLQPQNRVLDACCAPGGKSTHILEHCSEISELVSIDLEEARLSRVKENISRLQLGDLNHQLICANALDLDSWWDKVPFDRVLLDAPCSATGVIRRHPDIKLLRRPDDLDKLAELQFSLIEAMWGVLKPGGILLYATCSILPQENEKLIERFLTQTTNAKELAFDDNQAWGIKRPYGRQLFPKNQGYDGFYYARIQKDE